MTPPPILLKNEYSKEGLDNDSMLTNKHQSFQPHFGNDHNIKI